MSKVHALLYIIIYIIIIDVESNRKILNLLLKKKGLHTEMADNGQKAVDIILHDMDKFQLILMDNIMPIMVGHLNNIII